MTLALSAAAREMGKLVRDFRKKKPKLTLGQVAERLGLSIPHLSRVETGERPFRSETEIVHYLVACEASLDDIKSITEACRALLVDRSHWLCPHGPWMGDSVKTLIFHESQAIKSVSFEPDMVPGLLQTEAYARAVSAGRGYSDDWVDARVRERLARQQILLRNNTTKFVFFIHERALRLHVGDHQIMTEQLLAALFRANQPNVVLRVVPAAAGHRGLLGGAFRLFGFDRSPTLAYLDAPVGGVFIEDPDHVASYRSLNHQLADVALDAGQSRMLIAELADEHDRAEGSWDDKRQVAQE